MHLLEEPGTLEQVAELARGWSSTSAAAFAGIVTLEDLLEEIVGEIYDETDRDILAVQPMPECSLVLPGTFPIHDLPDINVDVTDAVAGDYTTIAGLVLAALGRIPTTPGDRIDLAHWTIEVTEVSHHAITEVRVRPRGHARGDLRP